MKSNLAISYLHFLLVVLLATSVFFVVSHCSWEGHLVLNNQTYIINLPERPLWSPPPVPTYETFKQTFNQDVPSQKAYGSAIVRVLRYDSVIFEFMFLVIISFIICGLPYLFMRRGHLDATLHFAFFIAVGFIAAALVCFVLWLLIGGWSPTFPSLFAFLGIGFGIYLGKRQWNKNHV
jgi:hypothetical protein